MREWIIICDFDGTITTKDVSDQILENLATGNWKALADRADAGEISMNECIVRQFEMLPANPEKWIRIAEQIPLRHGLKEFLEWSRKVDLPLICISAGLKPIIRHYQKKHGWSFPIIAPEIQFIEGSVKVIPPPFSEEYRDFKEHHVRELQKNGKKVIYIGDGGSDQNAIVHADIRCVVQGSTLEQALEQKGIHFLAFKEFADLQKTLDRFLSKKTENH